MANNPRSERTFPHSDWRSSVACDTKILARRGYLAFALALGLFVTWALTFPLASAVVTEGRVTASGENKLLQHHSGGVVRSIAVENGHDLSAGDLVVSIEPVAAIAELKRLRANENLLLAKKARLKGGSRTARVPRLPDGRLRGAILPASLAAADFAAADLATGDSATAGFAAAHPGNAVFFEQEAERRATDLRYRMEISALRNQLDSVTSERSGIERQIDDQRRLTALLGEQEKRMAPLARSRDIARSRLWDVQTRRLEAEARLSDLLGRAAALGAREAEIADRIDALLAGKTADDAKELSGVLAELAALSGEIEAAEKAVRHTEIRAPVAGRLANLAAHTIGGVIRPGEIIAEIVPADAPLHVAARIAPADIGSVRLGQPAEIFVTAHNRRLDDPLAGEVSYIGADSVLDELTGEPYFPVHLALAGGGHKAVHPGMIAETYIQIEARNFFTYLVEPVSESLRRAFRER